MKYPHLCLLVIACCLFPISADAYTYKGMSYGMGHTQTSLAGAQSDQSLAKMKAAGVTMVALNVVWFQTSTTANTMAEDFDWGSSDYESVAHAIDTIHSLGMAVMLKPMINISDDDYTWRAEIDPTDKDAWFASYRKFVGLYADLAEKKKVAMFSIGCELCTLEKTSNDARWAALIANIRSRYSGILTYSANWAPLNQTTGGYENITWWNQLDLIGIDEYCPIAESNNPTVAQMVAAWRKEASDIESWRTSKRLTDKSVIFTEVGYQSADGTAQTPWGVDSGPVDMQEQADCYTALFTVLPTKSWWEGLFLWDWDRKPDAGGPKDLGFSPQNKLAETVLKSNFLPKPKAR